MKELLSNIDASVVTAIATVIYAVTTIFLWYQNNRMIHVSNEQLKEMEKDRKLASATELYLRRRDAYIAVKNDQIMYEGYTLWDIYFLFGKEYYQRAKNIEKMWEEIQRRVENGREEFLADGFISSENDFQSLEEELTRKIYELSEDMKHFIESSINE